MGRERLSIVEECAGPTGVLYDQHREPTADDLVAWLQARPDLAVEVVGRLRVARRWEGPHSDVRRDLRSRDVVAQVFVDGAGVPRSWSAAEDELFSHDSCSEGLAAADAALVAAGWALAGSTP